MGRSFPTRLGRSAPRLILKSEVEPCDASFLGTWIGVEAPVWFQVATAESNFGEVGISQPKILSIRGFRVFNPPQLCDRWRSNRRPARPRMAPQVNTWVRRVAGSR